MSQRLLLVTATLAIGGHERTDGADSPIEPSPTPAIPPPPMDTPLRWITSDRIPEIMLMSGIVVSR